ncbi:N-methyl-L-tryptophan oxidase [Pseudomonas fragariae (ex Marin et al. 2024)]|uniref:N-methyl-L-tryptophan oxidase n=2 Tax=Pseudomonas fragariae (ex Marin et al. 2024) TaxID=3080056 RepID=A0ABT3LJD5_9PSED|nr:MULTISPECIES: N-methyl-L-tryptophan oxidase [unclassified Pseudomonas]MCW6056565.1 N-methyl-L-tryptophan oxidase [Pseudomonas fragi]MDV0426646.1 N-methyl-L-tryptophan oxidase [Pseudomonas sp. 17]MDX9572775.1 N-methyl-L-tryptophan oxidase [Pseudomonas sp. 21(2023)]MDX9586687.1 N-methyl-L-tryptophan oxidase [Pseudomonas sp. 19(2023)]MDX9625280.1 N-methyl-L-tryptophan oxidase [Pseudomonas sp. 20]
MQQRCKVAVLGLGAMGAATAYQLAKAGVDVIGIDRYDPPHTQGSSHGDTRITRLSAGEGPQYLPLVRSSQRIWRELEALSGESLFEQCGVLVMTSSPAYDPEDVNDFTHQTIALARTYGVKHEVLAAAAIRERFPQFAPVLDSAIGYFEPEGGFVRPERCIAVQLKLARQHGARLLTHETVTQLQAHGDQVRITTDKGSIIADKVVVSAGMWSADLLGAPFSDLLRVCRQKLFWFEVQQHEAAFAAPSPSFILIHGPGDADVNYGFPPLPGENSMKVATEQYSETSAADQLDRTITAREEQEMFRTQVQGRIAGLTPKVVKSSVCAYTVTPDCHFIIDEHPHLKNVTVVSACSGHGFKHSAGLGLALAQRCIEGESDVDLSAFSLQRFARQC